MGSKRELSVGEKFYAGCYGELATFNLQLSTHPPPPPTPSQQPQRIADDNQIGETHRGGA